MSKVSVKCSNGSCPQKMECMRWVAAPIVFQAYLCYDVLITQKGPWCENHLSLGAEDLTICTFRRPFWKDNKQREKELHALTGGRCHLEVDPPTSSPSGPLCAMCGALCSEQDSICDPCHAKAMRRPL